MKLFSAIAGAVALLFAMPADAKRPSALQRGDQLKPGLGAIRISIRSQIDRGGNLFVWFAPVASDVAQKQSPFRFTRKQGIPIAGTNMIGSMPKYFAMPPGRYRLVAHTIGCATLPPPNSRCFGMNMEGDSERYDGVKLEFEVVAGKLTDVGELITQFPSSMDIGYTISLKEAYARMNSTSIRWRPIAASRDVAFANLADGPSPLVPETMRSAMTCEKKPEGTKGMMMMYPFHC